MKKKPSLKKIILSLSHGITSIRTLSLVILLTILSMGAVLAHDVTVNITGTITNTTCSVSADSINKQVRLGTFITGGHPQVGDTSPMKSFTINLENCGELAHGLQVSFSGTPDTIVPDYFKLNPESTASGFAVKLMDDSQRVIPVGSTTKTYYVDDGATTKSLIFYVQTVKTDSATTDGTVKVTATFKTIYP